MPTRGQRQSPGLPILTVKLDRQALSRYGLSVREVQNVAEIAIGGKSGGKLFEGERAGNSTRM